MLSSIETQIRDNIRKVADDELSVHDFEQWFVPMSWNIENCGDPSAIAVVHKIDGILSESSSGNWSESDLRDELANVILPLVESRT